MTLKHAGLLALLFAGSVPAPAQERAPLESIALGGTYERLATVCRDRTDALEIAAAMEDAEAQQANALPPVHSKVSAPSCWQGIVCGIYVSQEFTYRLNPVATNVMIYIVRNAWVDGAPTDNVYVVVVKAPAAEVNDMASLPPTLSVDVRNSTASSGVSCGPNPSRFGSPIIEQD